MDHQIYTGQFEHKGLTFKVEHYLDNDSGAPWENSDFHGDVSDWRPKDSKRSGERVLCEDRRSVRFYDFAKAVETAKRDWIGPGPFDGKTRGQAAVEAVEADFAFLRGWCRDDWSYIGVVVTLCEVDEDGDAEPLEHFSASLWCIESNAGDYISEVQRDLADDAASVYVTPAEREAISILAQLAGGGSPCHP